MFAADKNRTISIIYDGECPVCSTYVKHMRLKQNYGRVELIDARENPDTAQAYKEKGLNLDEGMVVRMDSSEYYGPDAINVLALLSSSSGFFNRVNAFIFSNNAVSGALYPVMKIGRSILLRILQRSKIHPEANSL